LETTDQTTIRELQACRAKLVSLIKGVTELGDGKSSELKTAEAALKAVEKQIQALRARNAQIRRWYYPLKKAT
jgi:hypothetical protein